MMGQGMQGLPIPGGIGFGVEVGSGMSPSFLGNFGSWQDFLNATKALTTGGYGDTMSSLTGGAALRRQSLEATLIAMLQSQNDFELFNMLNKTQAGAVVDEFTVVDDTGSYPGAAVNSELGDITEYTGNYKRFILQIKYLMDKRRVSVIQDLQGAIASATATEQMLSTLALLTSCEHLLFNGDADCIPEEFEGLYKIVSSLHPEHVIDLAGASIGDHAEEIIDGSERISKAGTWGRASDVFWSTGIQTDMDMGLDGAFRVAVANVPNGGIQVGAPVNGIRSSFANNKQVTTHADRFVQEGGPIQRLAYPNASYGADRALLPTIQAQPTSTGSGSKFKAAHAGAYLYAVEAWNKAGPSAEVATAAVTVAAGETVSLTVRSNASETSANRATCYVVYRTPLDGLATATVTNDNFRMMKRVPVTTLGASQDTVVTDNNSRVPGTSMIFLLNLTAGMQAIDIRRLAPMTRFNLYPTAKLEIPWAQFILLALRVMKPRQNIIYTNALPKRSSWRPFN